MVCPAGVRSESDGEAGSLYGVACYTMVQGRKAKSQISGKDYKQLQENDTKGEFYKCSTCTAYLQYWVTDPL